MEAEQPVSGRYASALHLYPTLIGMLGAPLIRDRSISRRLSLVHTGGNAGLRGSIVAPIAWKTAHLRAVEASL